MTPACAICGEPDRLGEVGFRGRRDWRGRRVQTCHRHRDGGIRRLLASLFRRRRTLRYSRPIWPSIAYQDDNDGVTVSFPTMMDDDLPDDGIKVGIVGEYGPLWGYVEPMETRAFAKRVDADDPKFHERRELEREELARLEREHRMEIRERAVVEGWGERQKGWIG